MPPSASSQVHPYAWGLLMLHWSKVELAERRRGIMRAVAYTTRYGHVPLSEALSCDWDFLRRFNEALASLVREENAKPK
jgi:hypothetical protein